MGAVDLLHAAFFEGEGVRIEDRAAVSSCMADDLVQALLGGEAHDRQPQAGDLPVEAHELKVRHDLVAEALVHVQGAAQVIGRRVEHLEIGDGRVDPERVQGSVVPRQLEDRQRLALGVAPGLRACRPRPISMM